MYAAVNYIDKLVLEKYKIDPIVISIYTGISALITTLAILLFTGIHRIDPLSAIIIIISGLLTQFYLLPYFKALSIDEASRVIPLFQLAPIIVLVLGFIFLGEVFSIRQYLGSGFLLTAGVLLTVEKFDLKIFRFRPTIWYIFLACLLYGLAIFLFKIGLTQEVKFWIALPYEGIGIILGSLIMLFYKNNFQLFKERTRKLNKKIFFFMSLNDIIFISSRYTQYFALTILSAGMVSVLGGFQPLFALLYGLILSIWFPKILKEVISKENIGIKVFSIITIFIGLYLIFL